MKTYKLYVKIEQSETSNYSLNEALKEDKKRPQQLFDDYTQIEQLDNITSRYTSFAEINEEYKEIFNIKENMYDPVIIVDKDATNRDKSYSISDIVYASDKEELYNKDNIRIWLLEYLKENPQNINKFRGIKDIYQNVSNKPENRGKSTNYLIEVTILIYFEGHKYKRYREAYFTLKELDKQRVIQNEVHR